MTFGLPFAERMTSGAPAWIGDICPTGNAAGGSWQDPTIGGGHVGDQNILSYAAYSPWASADAGTRSLHSAWGYGSTDNGNNNQANPCADLNPLAKLFCAVVHAVPGPYGSAMMNPGGFGGQGPDMGGGSDAGASEAPIYHR